LLITFPLAHEDVAAREVVDAEACVVASSKFSNVPLPARKVKLTYAVSLTVFPSALIHATLWVNVRAVALTSAGANEPLPLISSPTLKRMQWPRLILALVHNVLDSILWLCSQ